jgi:formiminotetrahydrofolate cyclodeaminase
MQATFPAMTSNNEQAPAGTNIAQARVEDLIEAIGGRRISPGAGAAGAVTLALAAACAAKAVAISLVHQPDHAVLRRSQVTLESIARFALAGADRDAETFAAFMKEHTSGAIAQVIREGDRLSRLIDVLSDMIEKVALHIESNMAGDLVAARALTQAGRKIQAANSTEAHDEKAKLDFRS